MLKKNDGFISIEIIIAILCLSISIQILSNTASLKKNMSALDEDTIDLNEIWEEKDRCKIYCPKQDPLVDITF